MSAPAFYGDCVIYLFKAIIKRCRKVFLILNHNIPTMVYDYMVYINNDRSKYVNTISQLLCLISAAFFLAQQVKIGKQFYFYLVSFCIIVAGLAWNRYIFLKKNQVVYYRRMLVLAGATWFYMPFMQWLAAPLILLALIEKHSKLPLEIGITNDRIVFNTLIKREFYWKAFNNIMLKDGMLTLDFKNNRLFQKETVDNISDAEEKEFNEYCQRHLVKDIAELI